jgi:CheY-like chemotaxis protein
MSPHPHVPHALHVLVVDDELIARAILVSLLTSVGFRVQTTDDGGPALDMMRASSEPLLVTLDLMLPHVSGLTVLEAVAADRNLARRHALVVVTAAVRLAMHGRINALRTQLGIPLVEKPFDASQLFAVLAAAERRLAS